MTRKPLADLSLYPVLPPSSTVPLAGKKRALDPAVILSPSKRRVLEADVRFSGPSSPARKLDFSTSPAPSTPKRTTIAAIPTFSDTKTSSLSTPRQSTSSQPKLAPSPEITPQPARRYVHSEELAKKQEAMASRLLREKEEDNPFLDFAPSLPSAQPSLFTSTTDNTSPHYPGFDVHRDTSTPPPPASFPLPSLVDSENQHQADALETSKENLPPARQKAKRALTIPQLPDRHKLEAEGRRISEPSMKSPLASGRGFGLVSPAPII